MVDAGDTILPSQHNPFATDVASALSGSLSRDGQGGMRAPLSVGGFKATNVADPTNAQDAATKNYVDTIGAGYVQILGAGVVVGGFEKASDETLKFNVNRSGVFTTIWSVAPDNKFSVAGAFYAGGEAYALGDKRLLRVNEFTAGSNVNGYWSKRPDGNGGSLIEQWGIISLGGGDEGPFTITFPVPFTIVGSINISATVGVGEVTRDYGANIDSSGSITLTTAPMLLNRYGASAGGAAFAHWRAVGY